MMSYMFGPMKVYSAFDKKVKKEGKNLADFSCPVEYYYCDRIEFYFPLAEKDKKVTNICSIPIPEY